jgi:hypothetical protein
LPLIPGGWLHQANLDWEAWNPDWDVNGYAEYQIYQNRSIELVLSQHPTWSIDEATLVASIPPPTPTHPHDIQWIRSLAFSHIFCGKREGMKNAS